MSRKLDDMSPAFRPLAVEFLARLTEAQIPVVIVDTLRSPEEHAENLKRGVSWTTRSKHLTGDAMDVCPYEEYQINGRNKLHWDGTHRVWQRIGMIAEACGMTWGGRWQKRDLGHVELKTPEPKGTVNV